jgi:hypothetical protein
MAQIRVVRSGLNRGQYIGNTRAPNVSDDSERIQLERIGKVERILCHGNHFAGAHCLRRQKRCWTEAAQPGHHGLKTGALYCGHHPFESAYVVGPAVQ